MATRTINSGFVYNAGQTVSSKIVFVDLSQKVAKANVVRDGFAVPSIIPDSTKVERLLGDLKNIKPTETPRVVSQSIAPGTRVGAGTEINLIFAPASNVPVGVFDGVLGSLSDASIASVLEKVQANKPLRDIALKYESAEDVSEEDRKTMIGMIKADIDPGIDEASEQDFQLGFKTVRVALAFK